jgi:hypothetical protein
MINRFCKKATKKFMFLMKEIENRDGTLEVKKNSLDLSGRKPLPLRMPL